MQRLPRLFLPLVLLPLALLPVALLPVAVAQPQPMFPGDEYADGLALGVGNWLDQQVHATQFHTGKDLFDEEWAYGTLMMAAMGFGQHALANPDAREADIVRMEACIDAMMGPMGTAFERRRWGTRPLDDLEDPSRGHAAWLGYTNLVLALHTQLVPKSRYASLHKAVSDAIIARLDHGAIVETYPGEAYPVDNAAMIASLNAEAAAPALAKLRERWTTDRLLSQWASPDGKTMGPRRGSGTFLAAWFLSVGGETHDLYNGGRTLLYEPLGPLGAMREFPFGVDRSPDIDSGPILFGRGVSATAFAIGAARAAGDRATAAALVRTAVTFGMPQTDEDGAVTFGTAGTAICGQQSCGALADAILFAMMTTPAPG